MTREEAINRFKGIRESFSISIAQSKFYPSKVILNELCDMAIEALSAEATKKKAELKDDGDWDCPDVCCDECDHNRSVSWCSLAIPNHEEIDDTYKMVTEAFFEGFESAEKRYRLLIKTVEELEQVVRCKDCRHRDLFSCPLADNDFQKDEDYCSWGERREE